MSGRKGIRVLSICDDDSIRFSRELVLLQEGYEVESVTSNACLEVSKARSFHVAILCHSISPERAAQIAEKLRRYNPAIRVARVHAIRPRSDHFYDADCEVFPGPDALLSAIGELCAHVQPVPEADKRKLA